MNKDEGQARLIEQALRAIYERPCWITGCANKATEICVRRGFPVCADHKDGAAGRAVELS